MDPPEDRPWERPGAFRRDCEPHRGPLLVGLATTASLLGYASFCCPPVGAVSAAVGVAVLLMARRDEALMRGGQMDPHGLGYLKSVRIDAWFAISVGLFCLGCLSLPALVYWSIRFGP